MRVLFLTLLIAVLFGCSSTARAPVSTRGEQPRHETTVSRPGGAVVVQPARKTSRPRATRLDRYTVRRGDTLYSVAWAHGLTVGELAAQNRIHPPYTIYPGQQLRVSEATQAAAPVRIQPLPGKQPPAPVLATAPKPVVSAPKTVVKQPVPAKSSPPTGAGFDGQWRWPTRGRVLRGFKPNASGKKGIDIGGHHAQPVKAAAGGRVVYAGSGLVGYGRLIIIKHNENLLSAYGHNSKLLVAEGDHVKAGEMIAKMGNSGTNRTALYFEIRKDGKPVNPLRYLPRN